MDQAGGAIVLVGAGRMGGALLKGWLAQGIDPARIAVQEPSPPPDVAALIAQYGITTGLPPALREPPSVILLGVKPQAMDAVLPGVAPLAGRETVVLSVAAGRSIASMAAYFAPGAGIVRAMPNTPAAIGRGITALCANLYANEAQRALCATLMGAAGETVWVEEEALIDAVTAVSGSGPAYVFHLTECLAEAGRAAGLEAELAAKLARATVTGAGALMDVSGLDPAELRRNVTSPAGTTEAALRVLAGENAPASLQELLTLAVAAAQRRARELAS
jgi:pyrroline-5-carboxylate reductase